MTEPTPTATPTTTPTPEPTPPPALPIPPVDFVVELQRRAELYWDRHPYHVRLRDGQLTPPELRSWVANHWYYLRAVPAVDSAILHACPPGDLRRFWQARMWRRDGGRAGWLALAGAVGLPHAEVVDERHVRPGVRFAANSYVAFARSRPWLEGMAATLTEMFAPAALGERAEALRRHYPWVAPVAADYLTSRIAPTAAGAEQTLELVVRHCLTRRDQLAALAAMSFKCDVLWSIAEAVEHTVTCALRCAPVRPAAAVGDPTAVWR